MELEQLKDMWKEQEPVQAKVDVQPLLGKRSNTPIARMKRHLYMELVAVILLYGGVVAYYALHWHGRFISVSYLFLFIGSLFCVYFFRKRKLLNEMECMACQVKSNLSKQVQSLEKYIRFYLWAGTLLIPVVLGFFYWFGYTFIPRGGEQFFPQPSLSANLFRSIMIFTSFTVVLTVIFYFINKWYVNKLYGRYVEQMKQMLEQMEDDSLHS